MRQMRQKIGKLENKFFNDLIYLELIYLKNSNLMQLHYW